MNLGFDFKNMTIEGLRTSLEALVARVNIVWKKEHDPETGVHTDITADSLSVGEAPILLVEEDAEGTQILINVNHSNAPLEINATHHSSITAAGTKSSRVTPIFVQSTVKPALVNANARGMIINTAFTRAASGAHPTFSGVYLTVPVVTAGASTLARAATLHIEGPPNATTSPATGQNFSLLVDNGEARFSGLIRTTAGQIQFPATQIASTDVNTLDDYEEGVWTPNDASGAGLSITLAGTTTARYTKVGRVVMACADVVYPVTANGAAAMVGGLPFTCDTTPGAVAVSFTDQGNPLTMYIPASTTRAELYGFTGAAFTNANMSGKELAFTACYLASQ